MIHQTIHKIYEFVDLNESKGKEATIHFPKLFHQLSITKVIILLHCSF